MVHSDIDNRLKAGDHIPASALSKAHVDEKALANCPSKVGRAQLGDPVKLEQLWGIVDEMNADDWGDDSTDMHGNANQERLEAAHEVFGEDPFSPLYPYVSRHTIRLVRLRRHGQSVSRLWMAGRRQLCSHLRAPPPSAL
eukprot:3164606-Pyramimonas_sp.AAC.1